MRLEAFRDKIGQIKTALGGKDCSDCSKEGIRCHELGLLPSPLNRGFRQTFVDDKPRAFFVTPISECEVKIGNAKPEEMAGYIRRKLGSVDMSKIEPGL